MHKVDIKEYTVKGRKEGGEVIDVPYDMKASLITILFHPDLRLEAQETLYRDDLANKINGWKDGHLLLEDADYERVKGALLIVRGFTKNDAEFIRRILEAEKAEVIEKK